MGFVLLMLLILAVKRIALQKAEDLCHWLGWCSLGWRGSALRASVVFLLLPWFGMAPCCVLLQVLG